MTYGLVRVTLNTGTHPAPVPHIHPYRELDRCWTSSDPAPQGGRHVDHVADAITKQLTEAIKKKNKGGVVIKPFQIKNHMWVFINCLVVNPTFDSQTKENMTLQAKSFGSKCTLSDKFIQQVGSVTYKRAATCSHIGLGVFTGKSIA